MTRPDAIAALRAALEEVERGVASFRAALPQTNQPGPLAFFPSILARIAMVIENERAGATGNLAAVLTELRKDLRRHPLPDLDPDYAERTHALSVLRGERGNLVEALENALDACRVLDLPLRPSPEGALEYPRATVRDGLLRALDERLRRTEEAVAALEDAASRADAARGNGAVSQTGLINLSVRELKVDIAGARFEAKLGRDPGAPATIDLTALTRTVEAIRDTARDLRDLVQTLRDWVAPAVAAAGRRVGEGAERAWLGVKTIVRVVRRVVARETVPKPPFPPLTPHVRWREAVPGVPEAAWPDMVTLPPGVFTMGAPIDEENSAADEHPQRQVTVPRPFALGRTAVTFAMWDAARAAGADLPEASDQGWGRDQRPVINVSWGDAQAYCAWLNQRLGLQPGTYRLPSEAEWEYACRAGTVTAFSFGDAITTKQVNYDGNFTYGKGSKGAYREHTVPVADLPANPWGLHEMHGNVWEWCEDAYGPYPNRATDSRPLDHADSSLRVLRGGSWLIYPWYCRSASRLGLHPDLRLRDAGFRLARTLF